MRSSYGPGSCTLIKVAFGRLPLPPKVYLTNLLVGGVRVQEARECHVHGGE